MDTSAQFDYLLIGQGMAGSCMALQLVLRNKKILVYDQPSQNKSSSVAAGLFNPIIGKVMTHAWRSEVLFPSLFSFYPATEKLTGKKFFYELPLYRPFGSVFEQNEWMAQSAAPLFKKYIDSIFADSQFSNEVNDPFGGLLLKQCGYVDVPAFMDAVRGLLLNKSAYREARFDAAALEQANGAFRYQDIFASKIIFCGGMEDKGTPFFSWLPLRPLKGETLEIKIDAPLSRIYNKGVYLAPASTTTYKVGATYNPKDVSTNNTIKAKAELVEKLDDLLSKPYQISSQQWGFRPCAGDRRPYIGQHPTIKNMFVLNGLGTRGVSLAPYFSNQLADFMEGNAPIDPEATIARIKRTGF
jgi:glycine oxidase